MEGLESISFQIISAFGILAEEFIDVYEIMERRK